MVNWLADATKCSLRFREGKGGCNVLAGRTEAMSRTTLVHRQELDKGARYEWGHLWVEVKGKPGELRQIRPGVTQPAKGRTFGETTTEWLTPEHANVMSDLLRAAVVNAGGSSCGGKTLYEMIWDEMLVVTDRLIGVQEAGEVPEPDDVGAARSLAWVLAVMQNPYLPNVDAVREETMARWEAMDRTPKPAPKPNLAQRRAARRSRRA